MSSEDDAADDDEALTAEAASSTPVDCWIKSATEGNDWHFSISAVNKSIGSLSWFKMYAYLSQYKFT